MALIQTKSVPKYLLFKKINDETMIQGSSYAADQLIQIVTDASYLIARSLTGEYLHIDLSHNLCLRV